MISPDGNYYKKKYRKISDKFDERVYFQNDGTYLRTNVEISTHKFGGPLNKKIKYENNFNINLRFEVLKNLKIKEQYQLRQKSDLYQKVRVDGSMDLLNFEGAEREEYTIGVFGDLTHYVNTKTKISISKITSQLEGMKRVKVDEYKLKLKGVVVELKQNDGSRHIQGWNIFKRVKYKLAIFKNKLSGVLYEGELANYHKLEIGQEFPGRKYVVDEEGEMIFTNMRMEGYKDLRNKKQLVLKKSGEIVYYQSE